MSEGKHPEAPSGPVYALGLMSGTSMDGVDAALLFTDGEALAEPGPAVAHPYDGETRAGLGAAVAGEIADAAGIAAVERRITDHHAEAVAALLEGWRGAGNADPVVIGFHGHTLWHRPERRETRQIGDGGRLAALTGLPVVDHFRDADMAAGGEGAPLAPLYHAARLAGANVPLPTAVLNLGGVANVTWIGRPAGGSEKYGRLLAFDTGPGCALIDDWMRDRLGAPFDRDGACAAGGRVDGAVLRGLLDDPYFRRPPPKSLDRTAFNLAPLDGLDVATGAATLTAFTAGAVALAAPLLPVPARAWYATGGGRHNGALMAAIADALGAEIRPVDALGWNGDSLEAEAFAYLAVRSLKGAPLSLPETTGVRRPVTGGTLHLP